MDFRQSSNPPSPPLGKGGNAANPSLLKRDLGGLLIGRRAAILLLFMFLLGCGKESTISDQEPPPVPQFVPRSADTALVELGIDAVPDGDYISVSWSASDAPDVGGYRLYRRAEDSSEAVPRDLVADLDLGILGLASAYSYTDNSQILFTDSSGGFFYWITAYDESGNESGYSEEAYFCLMPKPDLQAPVVLGDTLKLSWNYTGQPFDVDYYVVRLFKLESSLYAPFWLLKYNLYNLDPVDYIGPLEPGTYRYQVDVIGASPPDRPSGSEAAYSFQYP